jgi:hypothetical protein
MEARSAASSSWSDFLGSSSGESSFCPLSKRGPRAKVKEFETIALTRKYDFARSIVSLDASRESRMPVDCRDWTRRRGSDVVLLKERAGVTH